MPNLSIMEVKHLRDAEKALRAHEEDRLVKPFTDALGENLLFILAWSVPYAEWPDLAKSAFEHTARQMPLAAEAYKARLYQRAQELRKELKS